MSNEVTTPKQTGLGALGALKTGLANVRTKLPEVASSPYLRLLKDGDWVFGQEDNAVAKGTEAVINPLSIKHGYSAWTNRTTEEQRENKVKNEPLGEIMVGLNAALPALHELEQKTDPLNGRPAPWKDQMSVDVKFIDGKHKGTQVMWKVSSVGGLNAAKQILDAILTKLDEGTPFVCPIITLESDSYKHQTYGKTYVPKIEVVGWTDLEGNEEDGGETAGELEAPKAVDEKVAETTAAPEQTEEAPRRRRRA
jgi:hypothetical protein